ncbi:MAG: polysaccharide biosynthesis/export family protein [Deltaproteobacteria bacterium]|nr:polysaccharide biosynthesis/export family protein [Deltaproteobacteria bacterium]
MSPNENAARPKLHRIVTLTVFLLMVTCIGGCSPSANDSSISAIDSPGAGHIAAKPCNEPELLELWRQRDSNTPTDFAVGPGDVITVSVSEVEELQRQQVRVAPDGTIALPLIGIMEVSGMSENGLRSALIQRLADYVKFPRVDLFVERYQARDVAVMGAVQKPGLYDLRNSSQSIMDVIGQAGGMTSDAAQKVIFVPPKVGSEVSAGAPTSLPRDATAGQPVELAANYPGVELRNPEAPQTTRSAYLEIPSQAHSPPISRDDFKGRAWIELDLARPGSEACLDLPTRPGDAVIVPNAGQVMVQGWVQSPGAYHITPGMTLLGAVSAAGGANFSWTAALLRTDSDGKRTFTEFSLTKLQKGEMRDVAVQSGDVVVVERSVIGAVPYTLFELFEHFGTGVGMGIPF